MARLLTTADTYAAFDEYIGTRDGRKVTHNTYAERRSDGSIAIRLHATDVLTFHADETITLNSGGWRTVTTKDRLNGILPRPLRVWSQDGVWTVSRTGNAPATVSEFYDGMRLTRHGDMVTDVLVDTGRELKRQKREIGRYVKLYTGEKVAALMADAAERGTAGDCFYCQMAGDIGDTEHLQLHIDEGYVMATLAYNALQRAGYRDPGLILQIDRDGSMTRRAVRKMLMESLTTSHGARPERDGNAEHWAAS